MMAAGGMGGGVAAAMARALGGSRIEDARALVLHALVLGAGLALLFTLLAWTVLPALFRLLGGEGPALANAADLQPRAVQRLARDLGQLLPVGAAARRRRRGDARPLHAVLLARRRCRCRDVLALGIGDWPGLGMAGPAVSSVLTSTVSALLQARALWRGKLGFVPALIGIPLQGRLFWDILQGRADRLVLGLHRQPHRHAGDRPGRPLRRRRAGRLRHRRAAGIHAGAARLRHRLGPHHAGRRRGRRATTGSARCGSPGSAA